MPTRSRTARRSSARPGFVAASTPAIRRTAIRSLARNEQLRDAAHRNADPRWAVVQLISELVEGFLGLEQGEQPQHLLVVSGKKFRHILGRSNFAEVSGEKRVARVALPTCGAK